MHCRTGKKVAITATYTLAVLLCGCIAKHFLKITYQLPTPSEVAPPRTVRLTVNDARPQASFLSATARDTLGSVSETLTLVVKNQSPSNASIGAYDLVSMLEEIFKQRLEQDGIQLAAKNQDAEAQLAIELKEFWLDLKKPKWILTVTYRMALLRNGKSLTQETISGQAERLQILGRKEAEVLMGELITDLVNRIDPHQLLQQAGL